jgi:hypothetical protein
MSFGQPRFAGINSLLNEAFRGRRTLIAVHRGTAIASIAENTAAAVTAALASGGDMVEIDVVSSTDGEFFAFHDGTELRLCGVDRDIRTMSSADIRALSYRWVDRPGRTVRVEPLLGLLDSFRGSTLFNIDRSWAWWPDLLPALSELAMPGQLLLKCAADNEEAIGVLRATRAKFPFMPICRTLDEAHRHLADPQLNTVGVELLAHARDSRFLDPEVHAALNRSGAFTFVNAEVMMTGTPLFAGYDDEQAVLRGPHLGWEPLFALGANVIQTDWPWLLRDFRDQRQRLGSGTGESAVHSEFASR